MNLLPAGSLSIQIIHGLNMHRTELLPSSLAVLFVKEGWSWQSRGLATDASMPAGEVRTTRLQLHMEAWIRSISAGFHQCNVLQSKTDQRVSATCICIR
jgi:hypothetical protein